ncbi:MAG: hypothetical protein KDI56_17645, partial [Xanthomonadales bacterium]|nr:hypothetical protein [Xanthomonadales bacterium]
MHVGRLVAANPTTQEVLVEVEGSPAILLAPFTNAHTFAQLLNGRWLVGAGSLQVQIEADGLQSRIVGRNSSLIAFDRAPNGEIYTVRSTDRTLLRFDDELQPIAVAQPAVTPWGSAIGLSVAGQAQFVVTNAGEILRHETGFLRFFSGGVGEIVDMVVNQRGEIYTADLESRAVGLLNATGYRLIANGLGNVYSVSLVNDDQVAVAGGDGFYSILSDGRWSRSAMIVSNHASEVKQSRLLVVDGTGSRVLEVDLGEAVSQAPAGTVMHRVRRSHTGFPVDGAQSFDFGQWLPTMAGQYEVGVRSVDPAVDGNATAGLYVGPSAQGYFDAQPSRTAPGTQ